MTSSTLPTEVIDFILEHIHSVEQLRALLLIRETATKEWSARELCYALRTSLDSARSRLVDLERRGLLASREDSSDRYYFYDGAHEEVVAQVAAMHETHRVSMIELIYSRPPDVRRQFADAFRIRGGGNK